MYSLVSTRNAAPTAYELERLRKSERTAILNNLIFESADMLADFAFILVLFDQSVSINLPPTWYTLAFECSVSTPTTAQLQPVREEIFQVAIAATVFFVFNALYRAGSAVFQIFANSDRIQGVLGWFMCLVGVGATVVDPWSGSVIIEHQLAPSYRDQELDDYRMTLKELRSNWTLLVLEDVPQFILQIIYAVIIARSEYVGLSPAWFVALATTLLHFASQLHEVVYLWAQIPHLKVLAATSEHIKLTVGQVENNHNSS